MHMVATADESSSESQRDEEVELMGRVADGDGAACRILVDRHLRSIMSFAYRMLGDINEAEDVAQETFLRLWKTASRWEPKAKLTTWMYRVARNLCVDRLRARRELLVHQLPERADPGVGASAELERNERDQAVTRALGELGERQRTAISLVYYQGMSNREAADVMEIQVDALESLLSRGRRNLRKQLEQAEPVSKGSAETETRR
jgi:RNA polymerase sigma-70 factor, ECF subfamily